MEELILCDICGQELNHYDRVAKLMPKCGHTMCHKCILSKKGMGPAPQDCTCIQCGQKQEGFTYETLPVNVKLMKIVSQLRGEP